MHELSVCQALMGQLDALAREQAAQRVLNVVIGVGPLSGVEPQLLVQAFPIAAAGSVAEGASLTIEQRAIRVHCSECGRDSDAAANRLLCGYCGNWRTQLLSGDELMLIQVEFARETAYV